MLCAYGIVMAHKQICHPASSGERNMLKKKRKLPWWAKKKNWRCPLHQVAEFRMSKLPKHIEGGPLNIGPGGVHCACCCPAPGSKDRKIKVRSARRKAKRSALAESFILVF